MSFDELIENLSSQLMIIIGIISLVLGFVGNLLNIYIFSKWCSFLPLTSRDNQNQRINNSSLYLLITSISNLIIIVYPLLLRILFDGYHYELTATTSIIYCKFSYFILHTFDIISLTCVCMATLDRYLMSSRQAHIRQLNPTERRAKFIVIIIICLNMFHGIPILFYSELSEDDTECEINSVIYSYYFITVYHILLHGLIPMLFLFVFGILTFKQLKLIQQRNLFRSEKQLSRMVLLISILIIISTIPNCFEQIHDLWLKYHDQPESNILHLTHTIAALLFFANPICCFYIFFLSTPNFRKELYKLFRRRRFRLANQVNVASNLNPVDTTEHL